MMSFVLKRVVTDTVLHAQSYRSLSSAFLVGYSEHGDPCKVLAGKEDKIPDHLNDNEVHVKMLAAPINPADINMIQGVYPVKPLLPAVGGNEGVGEVLRVGSDVKSLKTGDWVLPAMSGSGTWRTDIIGGEQDFIQVSNQIPVISAATLAVNPCTAYRMLVDFESLNPGDVVIQNAANSGVGQAVIQIAKEIGLKTVNIIRNRDNFEELSDSLKGIGANHVISDEYRRKPDMKKFMSDIPKPKLALNCVGGKSVADLIKFLDKKGTVVTYGGMSKQPLMVPAGPLIFNDIRLAGYWMTRWNTENHSNPDRAKMINFICDLMKNGKLQAPFAREVPLREFQSAISKAMESYVTEKQILVMK